MPHSLRWPVILLWALLALLTLSWVGAAVRDWVAIAASPERLSQLVSDFPFIVLPGVLGALGVRAQRPWGVPLFCAGLGALLYGVARTVAFLYWDNYIHVPWAGALALFVAVLAYVIYALRMLVAPRDGGP